MNPIDTQLEAVLAMLRAAGGQAHIDHNAPDYVKQAFLNMVLECEDCKEAIGYHREN